MSVTEENDELKPKLADEPAEPTPEAPPVEPVEVPPAGPDPLAALRDTIAGLAEQIQAHHSRAEARERVIDNLHAEVERLRAGDRMLLLRPVIADLQHLRTDLLRQARTLPADLTAGQAAELLESFGLSVELALERCGSVPVRPKPGDPFVAREHHAVGTVPADRPEQDGTVAAVLTDGYRDTAADRVIVPARVAVFRWNQVTEPAISSTDVERGQQENADD